MCQLGHTGGVNNLFLFFCPYFLFAPPSACGARLHLVSREGFEFAPSNKPLFWWPIPLCFIFVGLEIALHAFVAKNPLPPAPVIFVYIDW